MEPIDKDTNKVKLVVAGAGLSGLMLAWKCLSSNSQVSVTIIDSKSVIGGDHTWSFNISDVNPSLHKWLNPFIKLLLPLYTKKVIMQDVEIMKNQGNNLKTFKTKDYRSTQADTLHIYVESLRDWEENGKTTDKPKDQKRECEIWI